METMRMSKAVRRVVQLKPDATGKVQALPLYQKSDKERRRTSKELRWAERQVRRLARAQRAAAELYLMRHEKSNERRDGWYSDVGDNVYRALRRFSKVMKITDDDDDDDDDDDRDSDDD